MTLFAPDDPAACAAAVADLLADKDTSAARRVDGQAVIRESHDWARNASRYHPVYQALLNRQSAQRIGRDA
ncbi:MAG: hypothetical protein V4579_00465 [Pseudomonadota bacterium]